MRNLLFDLDGTLTEPKTGITRSIQYALTEMGYHAPDEADLVRFIGPPLSQTFASLLATTDERAINRAIALYRQRFGEVGMYENEVYAGMDETLASLVEEDHRLYLATSKPHIFATKILHHFDLAHHFQAIHGAELDGTRQDKADLIAYILEIEHLSAAETAMIGDRKHDILGSHANGVTAIGVLWGYGSAAELTEANATYLVADQAELLRVVRGQLHLRG
ncbi:MAG: HAD family hydrolase [Caldilineaceae bacterium]|nr:HAD family hydrolase [Caldilineaceae bacterium]